MDKLLLDSLEVDNFRIFHHFSIERLGRVNLISGRNSIGKSCLLESLWLYAHRGDPAIIWEILGRRGEVTNSTGLGATVAERTVGIRHLFHGRRDVEELPDPIHIGAINQPDTALSVGVGWYTTHTTDEGSCMVEPLPPEQVKTAHNPTLRLRVLISNQHSVSFLFSADLFRGKPRLVPESIPSVFLPAECVDKSRIAQLWDAAASSPEFEQDILPALRIVHPDIEKIIIPWNAEGRIQPGGRPIERTPCVALSGSEQRVPICSIGEGVGRVLGIALGLFNARDGLLLVDEIGNGLHYDTMLELWRWLSQMAQRLNVQVFATTHSRDCSEAFQQIAAEDEQQGSGSLLINMERQQENGRQITATISNRASGEQPERAAPATVLEQHEEQPDDEQRREPAAAAHDSPAA